MSLIGNLEQLSLLDILQIVNVSRRTGVLRLVIPGLGTSHVYFRTGNVEDVTGDFSEEPFLLFFEAQGLVEAVEVAAAKAASGGDTLKTFQRLMESGVLNPRLAEQSRRLEIARRLRALTQRGTGRFAFSLTETGQDLPGGVPPPFFPLSQSASPQHLLTQALAEASFSREGPPGGVAHLRGPTFPTGGASAAEGSPGGTGFSSPLGEVPWPPAAGQPQAGTPKSSAAVVLVSDDTIFRNLLYGGLVSHFSRVSLVSAASQFPETCRGFLLQKRPVLALVDLLMPSRRGGGYLGGLELLEESLPHMEGARFILMSDLKDERIVEAARQKGVTVLQKPAYAGLSLEQFEEAMDRFAEEVCRLADQVLPPLEPEVATFFEELGGQTSFEGHHVTDQLGLLKGLMGELSGPRESSEIALLILRLGSEYFERAVLLLVKPQEIVGVGGFGETGDSEKMPQKVLRLTMPIEADSLLHDALRERSTIVRKESGFTPGDLDFILTLGNRAPRECVAMPMISRGRVITILYGDNALTGEALPDLTGLEIFMGQAGLALEKALLELQLTHLQKKKDSG